MILFLIQEYSASTEKLASYTQRKNCQKMPKVSSWKCVRWTLETIWTSTKLSCTSELWISIKKSQNSLFLPHRMQPWKYQRYGIKSTFKKEEELNVYYYFLLFYQLNSLIYELFLDVKSKILFLISFRIFRSTCLDIK